MIYLDGHALKLSENILMKAVKQQATDIHFYPTKEFVHVYFRIHGERVLQNKIPIQQYRLLLAYYKFTAGMDIGEIRKPQSGTIGYEHSHMKYSLRLSTLPHRTSESLAIRLLPLEEQMQLADLFLYQNQLKDVLKWLNKKSGLILLTGPTGVGKSTTLYALLKELLQKDSYQIITLEDPIEKEVPSLLQMQINEKAGVTYESSLKAVLRHDPDALMIGEIREQSVAKLAFEAALTGHLVFSTLHAKDAIGTVHRLLDMNFTKEEINQTLIAVASLQLVPVENEHGHVRRAAILELLDSEHLHEILYSGRQLLDERKTFNHLRKKAYAYGFLSEKSYKELHE